jgi:outer membrane protein assembly factor BamA
MIENPWFAGDHLGYRLEYAHRERSNAIADFNETSNEVSLWLRTHLGQYSRGGGTVQFMNLQSDRTGVTLSPTNVDNVSRLGVFMGWDSRDSPTNTQKGWHNELDISREIEIFENSTHFSQMDLDIRRFQPLPFWDRHNLGLFSLLSLRTGEIGVNIAPWQAFGMGGTNTVRGWEYAARTGKNQFINFIEYRVTAVPSRRVALPFNLQYRAGLQFAAFADVGITWDESREFALNNTIAGGGVGVRLILPGISLFRFDVGWGQDGFGVRLQIGTLEKAEMARKRVR